MPLPIIADDTPSSKTSNIQCRLEELGLYLNKPELVIICRHCYYALKPTLRAVSSHLWEKHEISARSRQGLPAILRTMDLPDPNSLPCRANSSSIHPFLTTQPRAACRKCGFLSTSQDLIRRYLTTVHGLQSNRRHWLQDGIQNGLTLQSWTQNGSRKYWTVHTTTEAAMPVESTPRRRARLEAIYQAERDRINTTTRPQATIDVGSDDLTMTSNWIRRIAWMQTFKGADRSVLLLLFEGPALGGNGLELGFFNSRVL